MERDQLWKALFLPGLADDFFLFGEPPAFCPQKSKYHPPNALLLAELCRWVYNTDNEVVRSQVSAEPCPNTHLEKVGLLEERHFMLEQAQASLVRAENGSFHIVVFRGTSKLQDWLANLNAPTVRWWGKGTVHKGFMDAFVKIWEQLAPVLQEIEGPVFYTGHSLGGALATLTASLRAPQALYVFGSPRVGNRTFAESLEHVAVHRVVNRRDVVSTLPLPGGPLDYTHVGKARRLGTLARWNLLRLFARFRMLWNRRKFAMETFLQSENLFNPPTFLMDHAPLNYVRRLERENRRTGP